VNNGRTRPENTAPTSRGPTLSAVCVYAASYKGVFMMANTVSYSTVVRNKRLETLLYGQEEKDIQRVKNGVGYYRNSPPSLGHFLRGNLHVHPLRRSPHDWRCSSSSSTARGGYTLYRQPATPAPPPHARSLTPPSCARRYDQRAE
jgi:hypothetical protein